MSLQLFSEGMAFMAAFILLGAFLMSFSDRRSRARDLDLRRGQLVARMKSHPAEEPMLREEIHRLTR